MMKLIDKTYGLENTRLALRACKEAHLKHKMIVVLAQSGNGKTEAVKHYLKSSAQVYYVELKSSYTTKQVLGKLWSEIGGVEYDHKDSIISLSKKIAEKLNEMPGNKLIIIDEGGKFKREKVERFHEIYNLIEDCCGILICAPYYFEEKVKGWIDKRYLGVEEFSTRIYYWQELFDPTSAEIRYIFEDQGFVKIPEGLALLEDLVKAKKSELSWRGIFFEIEQMVDAVNAKTTITGQNKRTFELT